MAYCVDFPNELPGRPLMVTAAVKTFNQFCFITSKPCWTHSPLSGPELTSRSYKTDPIKAILWKDHISVSTNADTYCASLFLIKTLFSSSFLFKTPCSDFFNTNTHLFPILSTLSMWHCFDLLILTRGGNHQSSNNTSFSFHSLAVLNILQCSLE